MSKFKRGDWYCSACGDHQFAKNVTCRMCGAKKPNNVASKPENTLKPGDWICGVCGDHQFARRTECRSCGTLKGATDSFKANKDYLLVMDFEANCSSENERDHEIIEFPAVLINAKTFEKLGQFQKFVKMITHTHVSEFIKDLTHITDDQVNNGVKWTKCLEEFEQWCHDNQLTSENTTVVTCGDWDLKTMLHRQLEITKTKLSDYLNEMFGSWNNAKTSYIKHTKQRVSGGMAGMLKYLKLDLDGHHHSGIDDSNNIAKICIELMKQGYDVTTPNKIRLNPFWYKEHTLPFRRNKRGRIVKAE